MSESKKVVWWVVGVVVVVGLAWWGISQQSASANTIKVGAIFPLTGDAAAYGEPAQKTIELAVDQINAAGGINGKQLQIVFQDGQCTGQGAANAAQQLVNTPGVQAILGGFCSGESLAAVPIATAHKVLLFSPGSSSPKLTGASPYFFRDYPSDTAQAALFADYAWKTKHWKTIGILEEQTDYATAMEATFAQDFQNYGGKVVVQAFPTDTSDFRSILTTLRASNPDAILLDEQTPAEASRILDQMQQLGWKSSFMVPDAIMGDSATLQAHAAQFEGSVGAEFLPSASSTQYQAFLQAYKAKYGSEPAYIGYMATVYDAVNLLADGIKQVGYNGQALAVWSRTISNYNGASGNITIDSNGDREGGHTLLLIHDGQPVPYQQ